VIRGTVIVAVLALGACAQVPGQPCAGCRPAPVYGRGPLDETANTISTLSQIQSTIRSMIPGRRW
jgi:hypothetical protein